MKTTDQKRAKAGGEYGVNGEWYEGGKFIAAQQDRIKQAPMRHEMSEAELAAIEAKNAAQAARVARIEAWLATRREKFAPLIGAMKRPAINQWGKRISAGQTFGESLAEQLSRSGSLSPNQARCAVPFIFGRRNQKNAEARDEMERSLMEEFR